MVASAPTTNPIINILQPSVKNLFVFTDLTLEPAPVDPRFRVAVSSYDHVPVSRTSFMMTCVNEMSKLALLDWNGQVGSFRSTAVPRCSDVAIFLNVRSPAQTIQTRIAVWGEYLVFINEVLPNRFMACDIDLYWDDVKVARLRVRPNPATSSQSSRLTIREQSNQNQSLVKVLPTLPSLHNAISNLTNGSSDLSNDKSILIEPVFEAICDYCEDAETLNDTEVFATVVSALQNIAPAPKTSLVEEAFETGMTSVDARVQFQGPGEIPWHPQGPPYYQYQ